MEKSENEKILLVDDEEYLLKSLEVFLKNETNYEIFTASDGKEAIEIIDSKDIDLILTDLKMPEISGVELMEYVKGKSEDVPVIVMTAYASLNSAIEALRNGAYDYLIKPYEFDMVLIVIKRAIERIRKAQEAEETIRLKAIIQAAVKLSSETKDLLTGIMEQLAIFLNDLPKEKKEIKKGLHIMLDNSRKIAAAVKKFQENRKDALTDKTELRNSKMRKSGDKKILLVDDEKELLKSLERFFKNETNHEIFAASGGKEAIEIIDTNDIDLILTDLKMPEISGLELIEYVKGKSKDVPVIAMTAYGSLNSALEVLRVGAYDYLLKPYEFDMVLMVVERAIERARLTAESEEKNKLNAIAVAAVTLSHETNNLLTGIMGYLEIFLDDLPEDKKEIKKGLSIMLDNSRKIAAVVKKFQEVRKYVTTKYRDEETMLDLEKAISDVNK